MPPGTGLLGMRLFLLALFMLFAAAMVGYVFVRLLAEHPRPAMHHPPLLAGRLHFPHLFWLSTVLVIGTSFALSRAFKYVRLERPRSFLRWLWAGLIMAIGFLAVQAPAMAMLLAEHQQFRAAGLFLYGLVFILVLLHALHVLGGMVAIIRLTIHGHRGVYDHENCQAVRFTAMYWHFLDFIWICMFLTFLFTA